MKIFNNYYVKSLLFIIGDAVAIAVAAYLCYLILDSFAILEFNFPLQATLAFGFFSIIALGFFRMYQINWKFTGIRELLFIFLGLLSGLVLSVTTLMLVDSFSAHYFSFTFILFMMSILFVGGFRISRRMITEVLRAPIQRKRAVIFGAGNAADQLLRDFTRHHHWSIHVVAIFDDNENLHGLNLHGIQIEGDRKKMYSFLKYSDVDELIIAIPSLAKSELKKITDEVHSSVSNLKVKVLPSFHLLSDSPVGYNDVRRISIEDVLGREPIRVDQGTLLEGIQGKVVMITGAGGSIGKELVKQCIALSPSKMVALDVDETELFYLMNEYAHMGHILEPCVANVTDGLKMDKVMAQHRPQIIFHAAAYKHVPMMELFPEEAIKVNIGGTRILSKLSCKYNVEKFVLISTDKAVNPTNVMGATKSAAEKVSLSYNKLSDTKFLAVRFGNVLGSRGSVVPIFIDQIQNGGPITITHKDIKRYFMTIPEAVMLVMQAGMIGEGGEVFLLDMGEPVKIEDMALELIRLHGLQPHEDIKIEYTGLRPGEKMFEELTIFEEKLEATSHKLIKKVASNNDLTNAEIDLLSDQLLRKVQNGSAKHARTILKQIIPSYHYKIKPEQLEKEILD